MPSGLQQAIHDWTSTLPAWQSDLARRLAIEDHLDEQGLQEVVDLILGQASDGLTCKPLTLEDLPSEQDADDPVQLRSLGDMQNINCLAPGQGLRFEPGLNIVYGDTGAGKSGHTRLLRRCCRSVLPGEVLPDVFDPGGATGPQTSRIGLDVGGRAEELEVDLAKVPPRVLSSVSVFDAACARVYVSQANTVDLVPRPLVLFDRMVRAQDAVSENLRELVKSLEAVPRELGEFGDATTVGQLVGNLTADTSMEQIRASASLSDKDRHELSTLATAQAEMQSNLGPQLEGAARRIAEGVEAVHARLSGALLTVSDRVLADASALRTRCDETEAAQRRLASDALGDAPVAGTGDGPWKELWESARRVAVARGDAFPDPSDEARCELCQRELDDMSRARFQAFEAFVANDLETSLAEFRAQMDGLLQPCLDPQALRAEVEATLSSIGITDPRLADGTESALAAYASRRLDLEAAVLGTSRTVTPLPLPEISTMLELAAEQRREAERYAALRDDEARQDILGRLAELQDRKLLSRHLEIVVARVEALRRLERVKPALRELDTQKVSLQQRKLGSKVITAELKQALADELANLTPVPPRATVTGSARKGQTMIRLELDIENCTAGVGQVLSGGEQRALTTAFFLAELRVGANRCAIVLDDPVTSLDQTRRDYVARRLVAEAQERQVIIFTHDLAFVLLLQAEAGANRVPVHGQTLLRAGGRVGLTQDDLPFGGQSPQKRLRALRGRIGQLRKQHRDGQVSYPEDVEHWCVQIRQTWEQTIEEIVLNGAVIRFRPTIEPKRLSRAVLDDDIKRRVERGMGRTSPWAHYQAPALGAPAPTPDDLKAMADELGELHELLDPSNRKKLRAVAEGGLAQEAA